MEREGRHQSRIDTCAAVKGWDVPHIYGHAKEQIDELQAQRLNEHQPGRNLAAQFPDENSTEV